MTRVNVSISVHIYFFKHIKIYLIYIYKYIFKLQKNPRYPGLLFGTGIGNPNRYVGQVCILY